MMTSVKNSQETKKLLKKTWNAFFVRFNRTTEIQSMTVPVIIKGKNAIVISATASGKTEAVIAPLCERILRKKLTGLSVLYITPTRALANDLRERLSDTLAQLQITIDIKTGDSPYINWTKLPDIIITTPESLDSMICRHHEALESIEALVIDEIHILDGNYRGDQLRILISRLSRISDNFNTYALSATVDEPLEVAGRYMENPEVISAGGSRKILYEYNSSISGIYHITKKDHLKKILVFCNSRKKTEYFAGEIKKYWNEKEVFVHHGSLKKCIRHETEICLKSMEHAICVSTSTLEIGIDIGDIDAVVLADPPKDLFSFIQRIGRSGRRSGIIRVFMLTDEINRSEFEDIIHDFEMQGNIVPQYKEDYSVIVQQMFSVLFSNTKGLERNYFYELFENFCNELNSLNLIINHLIETEAIYSSGSKLFLSEKIMNLGEIGKIHSNIPDSVGMTVIDIISNREVGVIYISVDNLSELNNFILGGKIWKIVKIKKLKIYAKMVKTRYVTPNFPLISDHGAFWGYLPECLQN